MKRIIYLAAINFLFLVPCAAQENNLCPTVSFVAPDEPTLPGKTMTFLVAVNDFGKNSNLKFEWTVSEGRITQGQGTASIEVAAEESLSGKKIIAIVQIKGLNSTCKDVFFGTGDVEDVVCELPTPPATYDLNSAEEERATLDMLLSELTNSPNSVAVFYLNFRTPTDAKINLRISRILKHFAYRKASVKDKVVFVVVKNGNDSNAIDLVAKENLRISVEREEVMKVIKALSFDLKKPAKRK